MLISELLNQKSTTSPAEVIACQAADSIQTAVARMAEHNVGAVVVLGEQHVVGIFTERDVLTGLHKHGAGFLEVQLSERMTTKVIIVSPGKTVDEALDLMNENRIRHLPVVDKDKLIGVVSIRDLFLQKLHRVRSTAEFLQQQVQLGSKPLPM